MVVERRMDFTRLCSIKKQSEHYVIIYCFLSILIFITPTLLGFLFFTWTFVHNKLRLFLTFCFWLLFITNSPTLGFFLHFSWTSVHNNISDSWLFACHLSWQELLHAQLPMLALQKRSVNWNAKIHFNKIIADGPNSMVLEAGFGDKLVAVKVIEKALMSLEAEDCARREIGYNFFFGRFDGFLKPIRAIETNTKFILVTRLAEDDLGYAIYATTFNCCMQV
ncbi:hypothetical protein BC938DRAFT_478838 [Jimgerdemannia flammicorona]|uniref:Uncharacterized protein n=1 Tax=Jimgerdemannia flammicorona TaxID=994334 RepID=A0A433QM74_9FUNG|nr:hypothetical protein BC938DRAFT_478838 [Jimgerdemannia flammicorona]